MTCSPFSDGFRARRGCFRAVHAACVRQWTPHAFVACNIETYRFCTVVSYVTVGESVKSAKDHHVRHSARDLSRTSGPHGTTRVPYRELWLPLREPRPCMRLRTSSFRLLDAQRLKCQHFAGQPLFAKCSGCAQCAPPLPHDRHRPACDVLVANWFVGPRPVARARSPPGRAASCVSRWPTRSLPRRHSWRLVFARLCRR